MAFIPILLMVLVALSLAHRGTTPEQKQQLLHAAQASLRQLLETTIKNRHNCKPFNEALRARTRFVFVMPALVVVSATILAVMLYRGAALGDPQTLLAWGATSGPRTTNGEWWRLVTALILHVGVLQLLITIIVLVDLGIAIERLVGPAAVAVVYLAAGVLSNLRKMSESQVSVIVGSSGAVWGLYGLLFVWVAWGFFLRSPITMPPAKLKRIALGALLFFVYTAGTAGLDRSVALALTIGIASGLFLLIRTGNRKPSARRIAITASAAALVAVVYAVPLNGIVDVRPEVEQVVALETRTADAYKVALDQLQKRRISIGVLVQTINSTIVPPLEAADARLKTFEKVPPEQQGLLADAEKYVELRRESWRLRTIALQQMNEPTRGKTTSRQAETRHRLNISTFGKAEECERSSLEALKRIKVATAQQRAESPGRR